MGMRRTRARGRSSNLKVSGASGQLADGRTRRTCPGSRWKTAPPGRRSPPRTAPATGRRCSSPGRCPPTARSSPAPASPPTRPGTTTAAPPSTRCTSAKLVDWLWQNLRRCAGFKVQYFSAVEAQRRLAPHLHAAIRGAIPRKTIRQVTKATYFQLCGPPSTRSATTATGCRFGTARPADTATPTPADRCAPSGTPSTSSTTTPTPHPPTWCASGSRPTSKDCSPGQRTPSAVGYLCKYLTKSVADTYADPATSGLTDDQHTAYEAHIDRLHEQVLWPPCSPECANWLRYGIQPDAAGPGLTPGMCPAPHHDRENLGIGGRRVPVSRQWSGKTLTEHRADRAAVVRQALEAAGIDAPEADRCAADVLDDDGLPRFVWEDVPVDQRDYPAVILASVREHRAWKAQYEQAKSIRDGTGPPVNDRSATKEPAVMGGPMKGRNVEKLLTVKEAGLVLGTTDRFPRRPHLGAADPVRAGGEARAHPGVRPGRVHCGGGRRACGCSDRLGSVA